LLLLRYPENVAVYEPHVALYHGCVPPAVHVLLPKVIIHVDIPEISVIAGYDLDGVFVFLLEKLHPSLSRRCEVVPIRKVKPFPQVLFELLHVIEHLIDRVY